MENNMTIEGYDCDRTCYKITEEKKLEINMYDEFCSVWDTVPVEQAEKLRDFLNYHYPKE